MIEPHQLSAADLGIAYRCGTLSPVEAVKSLLARAERLQPQLHAFIAIDHEGALQAAAEATREMAAGQFRGPLHGIPIGIKDVIDVAGLNTTCHSRILENNLASTDAEVVSRLRAAGAIILGKLATHEFALGGPSFDLPWPPARNPWNLDHHPGGSSSGSGAGLAARLFPLSLGTDTAGSIRNPAGACGIVGLKPTYGLLPRRGVFPLAFSLDHVGPMARTVQDTALLLDTLIDGDQRASPCLRMLEKSVKSLRIGFVRNFHEMDMPADPEVANALEKAASGLKAAGASVRSVTLPDLNLFSAVCRTLMIAEAWSAHASDLKERPQDYAQSTRSRFLAGAFLTAGDYLKAQRLRARLIAAVQEVFRDVDVLLTASAMDPPCRIDDAQALARTYPRQARMPFNVTGHPALAMAAGISESGLPLSIQFVGRYFEEHMVLRVARAHERIGGWDTVAPPAFA